ncbi:hypothetical protein SAMD00019534_111170 [Acytostelium subglobosum LB1]|uniref:hypothetical protein n=1 Tax=Acytostelium subglobosum LB1 TaxID=1410327 RepID=UPI000644D9F9|nr:hypothetical protein SAMD00019534_111170 [Acytostelium subglobosum LB1]GAM27941.1 hypothetical protein SAMD00019534_111170 [Acytostelium subglobosum LB1]|eukprot:XP_012749224.1 hypothetical protein SAMD00019534_111170 [Acytostelium subglobosum LB1]
MMAIIGPSFINSQSLIQSQLQPSTIKNVNDVSVVQGLIGRILGSEFIPVFQLTLANNSNNEEYFSVSSTTANTIQLTANTPVNLASALNYYLKYYAMCTFSWTGDQCSLKTSSIPSVPTAVTINVLSQWRYYMNVCTFGYSTVWWDWPRWEREIDWMALNGYNLPLAFVGQEYVWYEIFKQMGLSEAQLMDWFTGPAFLPWNRMGNVNQWAGNLTMGWMSDQMSLQIQILGRMRQYGMKAVLPGFAGHVPQALSEVYPKANIVQLGGWGTFNGTYYLDPSDPLFSKIAQTFIFTQDQLYGTDHYYNFDPFNELEPPSNDTTYLHNCSKLMFSNLLAADPNAIWVLQGWFLVDDPEFWQPAQTEAFLSGVPIGKLLVLDLWADVIPAWNITKYFYGHNWIWCMLHNFGGRTGMYGKIPTISTAPIIARGLSPGMVGTGLTPEAIEQNVIVYDLMNEMAWRATPPNLQQWVENYVSRRYGKPNNDLSQVWYDMVLTVFNCTEFLYGTVDSLIGLRPHLNWTSTLYYNPDVVNRAWSTMVAITDPDILATSTFQFDIAEVTTQALSNIFLQDELIMNSAFLDGDLTVFLKQSEALLNLIADVDTIVSTQQMLLIGNWTARARALTPAGESTDLYEFNARNQVTLWGPYYSDVHDYAYKLWGGLTEDYYLMRWTLFTKYLAQSLTTHQPFDYNKFVQDDEYLESYWGTQTNKYPTEPTGNAIDISRILAKQHLGALAM